LAQKTWPRNTVPATAANIQAAVERAVDDPRRLLRAAQICKVAIERGRLNRDLTPAGEADDAQV
jgi:hypothetical protein